MDKFELYDWFNGLFNLDKLEQDDVKTWLRKQIKYPVAINEDINSDVGVNTGLQIKDDNGG